MKKIFIFLAATVMLAGCSKDGGVAVQREDDGTAVTVTVVAGIEEIATKAASDSDGNAKCVNHWIMEVRDKDNHLYTREERSDVAAGTLSQTFKVTLLKGNDYSVQFWADTKGFYKTDSLTKVCLNSKVTKASAQAYAANKDSLDCFSGNVNYKYSSGQKSITATLKRPLAQLNIQTTDLGDLWTITKGETSRTEYDRFEPKKLCATVKVPTAFNVQDSSVSEVASIELYSAAVHTAYQTDSTTLEGHNNFYNHVNPATLLMGYVFAGAEKALYGVNFTFQSNGNDVNFTFSNVPLQRNYRTNVKGKLLTDDTEWTVTIDPDWDGESEPDPVYPEAPALACVKIGNVWWAPVNCGYDAAHTYGSLYQWGRKYGQPYEDGQLSLTDMTKSDDTAANSGKFGKYDATTYNWFSGAVDNTLWNGSSKGTSDPCPDGWRVPTEAEFNALISQKKWGTNTVGTVSQTGYWFNGSSTASAGNGVFLPAAGVRYYSNGKAASRGAYGQYWSSSPGSSTANYARYMGFDSSVADMQDRSRADGYSVRCVKE